MKSRIVCYRLEASVTGQARTQVMPAGVELLCATYHNGAVGLWARVPERPDPSQPGELESREILLVNTGDVFEGQHRYLGTCAAPGGTFCVHVMELLDAGAVPLAAAVGGLQDQHDRMSGEIERLRLELFGDTTISDLACRLGAIDEVREALGQDIRALRTRVDTLESRTGGR